MNTVAEMDRVDTVDENYFLSTASTLSSPSPLFMLFLGVAFLLCLPVVFAQPSDLKVMTFNIRYAGGESLLDANGWVNMTTAGSRRNRVLQIITDNAPDILGVQEALDSQVKDLHGALKDYSFYGIGRDDGKTRGEYVCLFYRTSRFVLSDSGSFWLSKTPDTPGTTFSARPNANARIASWVKLADKQTSQTYCVLNTHWDNQDAQARLQSAELIGARLQSIAKNIPILVLGDLNAIETDPAVRKLLNNTGLQDSYRFLHATTDTAERTFHDFTGETQGSRIDFILHAPYFAPIKSSIPRTQYNGHYPSDHYPLLTIFHCPANPQ